MRRETRFIAARSAVKRSPRLARRGGRDQRNIAKHRVERTGAEREPGRAKHQEWLFHHQREEFFIGTGSTTPSVPAEVASQSLFDGTDTPPGQEGRSLDCPRLRVKFRQLAALSIAVFACTLWPLAAIAQEEGGPRFIEIPNPMAAHNWFIIAAVGAFLAWCISYVLQFRRNQLSERSDKEKRTALLHEKEEVLDRLAQLESEKEAGTIPGPRYEKEYRKARSRLSDVLSRLGANRGAAEN